MSRDAIIELAADIVSAYVSNNSLPQAEIPAFIRSIHASLSSLGGQQSPAEQAPVEKAAPAVTIKKSVTHDHIVCLEDGKSFKSLKRHLRADHNMTADQYRAKWGLPPDYPMVAPIYAAQRSELAKSMGLGRKPGQTAQKKSK